MRREDRQARKSGLGNLRRSRGYSYEHTLVQRFNAIQRWSARRLGGSSTGLPDIVAVNNDEGVLLTIEAKSGTSDILYVPQDQIERCIMVREMFGVYPDRHIILAFKFMSKKRFRRKNQTVYEQRRLVEYYKVADVLADRKGRKARVEGLPIVKCTYDGRTFALYKGDRKAELNLPDYAMPFHKAIAVAAATAAEAKEERRRLKRKVSAGGGQGVKDNKQQEQLVVAVPASATEVMTTATAAATAATTATTAATKTPEKTAQTRFLSHIYPPELD